MDWFRLQDGDYVSMMPDENGAVCSQVLPGLWLAVGALLAGDMSRVLTVLQEGINSTEHAAFVKLIYQPPT